VAGDLAANALAMLQRWRSPDGEQERLRLAYVDLLRQHPDAVWRTCVPAHLTASTLVLDSRRERVLLALHGKGGFWRQFGGHCEPADGGLDATALREAREESGIDGLCLVGDAPVDLDRHALSAAFGTCGEHLDVRFVAVSPERAIPARSAESSDVRWFDVAALPGGSVSDLNRLVRRAIARAAAAG